MSAFEIRFLHRKEKDYQEESSTSNYQSRAGKKPKPGMPRINEDVILSSSPISSWMGRGKRRANGHKKQTTIFSTTALATVLA